jgi:hypothetical protein
MYEYICGANSEDWYKNALAPEMRKEKPNGRKD